MTVLELFAPFDAGAGANVTEATWRKFMRHMLGSASGVIRGFTSEFEVFADSTGMQVKVRTGECWMRGHYGESTTEKTLAITAAHATLARKDRVVLRADFLNNLIEVVVLTGTAASTPVAPVVTQNTSIWETSLAIVDIAAAAVTLAAATVTDDRVFTTANAKYIRTASAQAIATNSFTKLIINQVVTRSGDVTVNAGFTDFTLLRSGLWALNARCEFAANGTGGRQIQIQNTVDSSLIYTRKSVPGGASFNTYLVAPAIDRFPANTQISVFAWQNSGANLNANLMDLTLVWLGP